MTIVLHATLDPFSQTVTVNSGFPPHSEREETKKKRSAGMMTDYALSIIKAYIFMIVFNTPATSKSTGTDSPSAKKGSRNRTVIGISQTPVLSSSEFNRTMSAKDKLNGARWMLVAICGPFSSMDMAMNVVSECKFETKGTRSKVTKLIRLADGIRRTTDANPVVYLNTGTKSLPPEVLVV